MVPASEDVPAREIDVAVADVDPWGLEARDGRARSRLAAVVVALERQAIRRLEQDTLSAEETESIGLALMRLEETVRELGAQFGLAPEDLTIDLGPIGKLV
jgi:hypothetical protein